MSRIIRMLLVAVAVNVSIKTMFGGRGVSRSVGRATDGKANAMLTTHQ